MLQTINDKAKGWVAYTVVGLIAVPFALFGISSYTDGGHGGLVAATVNGEEIPVQQVQQVVLQQRQRLAQMFGGQLPPNMSEEVIKNQALDLVVNEMLLRQEAENNGYRASNQEVYDTISGIPAFQINGQFDPQSYERTLVSQNRNKSGFEAQIRDGLSNEQFTRAVTSAAFLPVTLSAKYQGLENQTRDVEIFTLKKNDYESQVSVTDDEIKTVFDANAKDYMTSDKLKLSYVLVDQDVIAAGLSTADEALKLFYDDNQSRYVEPEKRKLAHIVVEIDEDKNDEAKAKAQGFYDQIQSKEKSFEEIAVASSDDEVSAKKNGEIGIIGQGEAGVLFDAIAFAPTLFNGSMTQVVETEAGYEIIKVLDIIEAKTQPFEEVKAEVEKLYKVEEAEKLFISQTDELQTLAFEIDSSLDEAADAIGATLQTSDWIEKNASATEASAENPLSSPRVLAAAFSDDVLNGGKNSELIALDAKRAVIIRLEERELPKQKELSEVEADIRATLLSTKLDALLLTKGDEALSTLSNDGAWTSIENIGATPDTIQTNIGLKRVDVSLARNVVSKIFSMQKPEAGKSSFDSAITPNGDYALISLSKVTDDTSEVDTALQLKYTQSFASRESAAVIAALREKAEVELFLENIQ